MHAMRAHTRMEHNRAPLAAGAPSEAFDYDGWTPSTYTDWGPDDFIKFIKELTKWQLQTEKETTKVIDFVKKHEEEITREQTTLTLSPFSTKLTEFCNALETTADTIPPDATLIAWPILATALMQKLLDHLTAINELQDHLIIRREKGSHDQLDSQTKLSVLTDKLSNKIDEIISAARFPTAAEEVFLTLRQRCKSSEKDWREKQQTEKEMGGHLMQHPRRQEGSSLNSEP
jgi:hypothetical protein